MYTRRGLFYSTRSLLMNDVCYATRGVGADRDHQARTARYDSDGRSWSNIGNRGEADRGAVLEAWDLARRSPGCDIRQ